MRPQGEEGDVAAAPVPRVAIHYAKRGCERVWLQPLLAPDQRGATDGAQEALMLHRRFSEAVGDQPPLCVGNSAVGGDSGANVGGDDGSGAGSCVGASGCLATMQVRLRVVPAQPGGPQVDVLPRSGQSLLTFLTTSCRDDHGVFQLRAEFGAPSGEGFVLVRVALPGTATSDAAAAARENASGPPPMLVEQFECEASAQVASLKKLVRRRTGFPINQMVLLLGCRRLHDELPMARVAAAAEAAGTLQLHLAARGALVFLRREGQGWPIAKCVGGDGDELPCSCTIVLPSHVRGSRTRSLRFDPKKQTVRDLRLAVQSVSGLPLAGTRFAVVNGSKVSSAAGGGGSAAAATSSAGFKRGSSSRSGGVFGGSNVRGRDQSRTEVDTQTLEAFGLVDGSRLEVTHEPTEEDFMGDCGDLLVDTPTAGNASELLERAAGLLGLVDGSRLALFAAGSSIRHKADLSSAPLADGAVLSAYVTQPLVLSYSVFSGASVAGDMSASIASVATTADSRSSGDTDGQPVAGPQLAVPAGVIASSSSTSVAAAAEVPFGAVKQSAVRCLTSDTIAEVRERILSLIAGSASSSRAYVAALRRCKVFAVDRSVWNSDAAECQTLGALAKLVGGFSPCDDDARLSRLGVADESGHLILVPEKLLLVEVQVHTPSEDPPTVKKLRVPTTARLSELVGLLDGVVPKDGRCRWARGNAAVSPSSGSSGVDCDHEVHDGSANAGNRVPSAPAPPPQKRRRSFGGGGCSLRAEVSDQPVGNEVTKRRRRSFGGSSAPPPIENEIVTDEFIGDLYDAHPAVTEELPNHFLCPISCEIMRDPVFVVGSGNTYEKECIEKHLQRRYSDPLSNEELRRPMDRRLVSNHLLRSQIDEAERSLVNLRLAAHISEQPRSSMSLTSDAGLVRTLSWCASLLRGSA
eukprot:TRINITY_DN37869_c0_g1_i1.p1 TRINITY_DN37869_c0_g1~~TRINITY_DN37869_c0_g1_i1.p1  ORF type:complete len:919 (+),score=170.81 TRINITY_DN37869_c0_g1_i1:50-2806(+)